MFTPSMYRSSLILTVKTALKSIDFSRSYRQKLLGSVFCGSRCSSGFEADVNDNVLHCRQRRTEPRPQITRTEKFCSLDVFSEIRDRTVVVPVADPGWMGSLSWDELPRTSHHYLPHSYSI